MAIQITNAFITQYEAEVQAVFQRQGARLRQTVRTRDNVVGSTCVFQKIGKGTASTKARHGVITPMNQDHTAITCTLNDFYAGDWVDKLDEAKTNIDERMALATGGAYALGRKVDDQILTALDSTTQSTVTWTVTSQAAIRNALLNMVEAAWANDVPNDGQVYGVLSPKAWAFAMTVDEFKRADYIGANGLPYVQGAPVGQFINFLGVKWTFHTGVPRVGASTSAQFVFHKNSAAYATGAFSGNSAQGPVAADFDWYGDRQSWFVNHSMSGGAALIDDTGVIKGSVDDTANLPTS